MEKSLGRNLDAPENMTKEKDGSSFPIPSSPRYGKKGKETTEQKKAENKLFIKKKKNKKRKERGQDWVRKRTPKSVISYQKQRHRPRKRPAEGGSPGKGKKTSKDWAGRVGTTRTTLARSCLVHLGPRTENGSKGGPAQ